MTISASPTTVSADHGLATFTVKVQDQYGNLASGYTGTVGFTTTDPLATPPGNYTFTSGVGGDNGTHAFTETLKTVGNQTVTATDVNNALITGTSNAVTVTAGAATHYKVVAPSSVTAGSLFVFSVTALDQFNNVATTYGGTAHFTSTDTNPATSLPAPATLPGGGNSFAAELTKAGVQTLTATDGANATINGSTTITVSAAASAAKFAVTAPTSVAAGTAFNVTVAAQDQFGNPVLNYLGTVKFTTSDPASVPPVVLPANYHFVVGDNGVHVFVGSPATGVILITAGVQSVTATDTTTGITGMAPVTVTASTATHFSVIANPSTVSAGSASSLTVIAQDSFNNTVMSYAGTVNFSGTGGAVFTAPSYTFSAGDAGTHVFVNQVTESTIGTQTVTATDSVNPTITGSNTISVTAGQATHFVLTVPGVTTAGNAFNVTVTALDASNDISTSYTGNVKITSSDTAAVLPGNAGLTNGIGVFTLTLKTVGTGLQTVTASDAINSGLTSGPQNVSVVAARATHFSITGIPSSGASPLTVNFTVTALDRFGNTANSYAGPVYSGYTGTVQFSTTDPQVTSTNGLPPNYTFTAADGGVHTFSIILKTAGVQTLTATDTALSSITATSNSISVTAAADYFVVLASPTSGVAGGGFAVLVTAYNSSHDFDPTYSGIVTLTCPADAQAVLPPATVVTGGYASFAITLKTAGVDTITATDTLGTTGSALVTVTPGPVSRFAVTAPPGTLYTGAVVPVTVTAEDAYGNKVTTSALAPYTGTVQFSSSDGAAVLPSDYTFTTADDGVHVFNVTLNTAGSQTITATDTTTASITGTTSPLAVRGLVVTGLTVTTSGFVATFSKAFDPNQLNLYNASTANLGPADVTLTGPGGAVRGSLVIDPSNEKVTFVKTSTFNGVGFNPSTGTLAAGSYTLTLRSAANGFTQLQPASPASPVTALFLDGADSGIAGANYVTTFVVSPSTALVVGVPAFARGPTGPTAPIVLPNNTLSNASVLGIPLNISNGSGVTSVDLTLTYNPALLTISGVTTNTALPSAGLTLDAHSTPGNAIIEFTSPTSLASGVVSLGALQAYVPLSAVPLYKEKGVLQLSGVQVDGGALQAVGDNAVEVNAYFGDVSGEGGYNPLDAALISRVATTIDTGFASFPNLDPVIIGDIQGTGLVTSTDVTLMNQEVAGVSVTRIPTPTGLSVPTTGADPSLSVAAMVQAAPGSTVVVPINIDTAKPDGSTGLIEATLALTYDPRVFNVTPADVELGSLTDGGGWEISSVINARTGEIAIDLFSTSPIQTTVGGSLVNIAMQVRDTAPAGASGLNLVNQVNPTGQHVYYTQAADGSSLLVLHMVRPAPASSRALRAR